MLDLLTNYNTLAVFASAMIALVGPTVGINALQCARTPSGQVHWGWLLLAVLMFAACGMWAANYAGLIAFDPGFPMTFDTGMTVLSLLAPLVFTTLALIMITRRRAPNAVVVWAAVTMTMGMAAMHYGSVAALRVPAEKSHEPALVGLSVIVGFVFVVVALYSLRATSGARRYLAAIPMALAVLGLHYTCMAGASFSSLASDVEYFEGALTPTIVMGWVVAVAAAAVVAGLALAAIGYLKREMAQADGPAPGQGARG